MRISDWSSDVCSSDLRAIQETFWTKIQGKDRHCAESFVFAYMDTLRTRCEIKGEAKDIGGGCAHMTNAMNYPEVLQAGLEPCDIKYSITVPRPNNAFKPKIGRGSCGEKGDKKGKRVGVGGLLKKKKKRKIN